MIKNLTGIGVTLTIGLGTVLPAQALSLTGLPDTPIFVSPNTKFSFDGTLNYDFGSFDSGVSSSLGYVTYGTFVVGTLKKPFTVTAYSGVSQDTSIIVTGSQKVPDSSSPFGYVTQITTDKVEVKVNQGGGGQNIPEPISIVGSLVAGAFGVGLKRRLGSRKTSKSIAIGTEVVG